MTRYHRIMCLRPQSSDNANRITVEWEDQTYSINQRLLNRYESAEELKAALDLWTEHNLGYVINDIWFHLNRDGTWAIATGAAPPDVWPEDMTETLPSG
jgi:hypothetical protein